MITDLKEAIEHCNEEAQKLRKRVEGYSDKPYDFNSAVKKTCLECASEHEQLAAWLEELAERREVDKNLEELADFWKDSLFGEGIRFALKAIDEVKKRDWEREDENETDN